jgi:hypothetical protein
MGLEFELSESRGLVDLRGNRLQPCAGADTRVLMPQRITADASGQLRFELG